MGRRDAGEWERAWSHGNFQARLFLLVSTSEHPLCSFEPAALAKIALFVRAVITATTIALPRLLRNAPALPKFERLGNMAGG